MWVSSQFAEIRVRVRVRVRVIGFRRIGTEPGCKGMRRREERVYKGIDRNRRGRGGREEGKCMGEMEGMERYAWQRMYVSG